MLRCPCEHAQTRLWSQIVQKTSTNLFVASSLMPNLVFLLLELGLSWLMKTLTKTMSTPKPIWIRCLGLLDWADSRSLGWIWSTVGWDKHFLSDWISFGVKTMFCDCNAVNQMTSVNGFVTTTRAKISEFQMFAWSDSREARSRGQPGSDGLRYDFTYSQTQCGRSKGIRFRLIQLTETNVFKVSPHQKRFPEVAFGKSILLSWVADSLTPANPPVLDLHRQSKFRK